MNVSPYLFISVFCLLLTLPVIFFIVLRKKFRIISSMGWYLVFSIGTISAFCMIVLCVKFTGALIDDDRFFGASALKHGKAEPPAKVSGGDDIQAISNFSVLTSDAIVSVSSLAKSEPNRVFFSINDNVTPIPIQLQMTLKNDSTVDRKESSNSVDPKDMIGNAMTAVALSISAITLVVSLGATWMATRMKELDEAINKVNISNDRVAESELLFDKIKSEYEKAKLEHERARIAADKTPLEISEMAKSLMSEAARRDMLGRRLLFNASSELYEFLKENSSVSLPFLYLQYQFSLGILMDESEGARKKAFGSLIQVLHPTDFVTHTEKFKYLQKYFEYCSKLHGTPSKWCLIFSQDERNAFAVAGRGNSSVDF